MKFFFSVVLMLLGFISSFAYGSTGRGQLIDVTIAQHYGKYYVLARVSAPNNQPTCVNWLHTFAREYDGTPETKAIYAALLTAQASKM